MGPHHNPAVESERPGYCVCRLDADLFACAPEHTVNGEVVMVRAGQFGWCRATGQPIVWASLGAASTVAMALHAKVVTVPRCNGYCKTWGDVAMAMGGDRVVVAGAAAAWGEVASSVGALARHMAGRVRP